MRKDIFVIVNASTNKFIDLFTEHAEAKEMVDNDSHLSIITYVCDFKKDFIEHVQYITQCMLDDMKENTEHHHV